MKKADQTKFTSYVEYRSSKKLLKVPLSAILDAELTSYSRIVYLTLLLHMNEADAEIKLSYTDISEISRVPRTYVKRSVDLLKERGYLDFWYNSRIKKTCFTLQDPLEIEFFSNLDIYKYKNRKANGEKFDARASFLARGY